jgi:hypothetical protein
MVISKISVPGWTLIVSLRQCLVNPIVFFEGALIDQDGVESRESGEPVLATCENCFSFLKRGKLPRLALPNHNFLGPVPGELTDLTMIEEAMIARCAKCWILQLKEEDDYSTPITQSCYSLSAETFCYCKGPTSFY